MAIIMNSATADSNVWFLENVDLSSLMCKLEPEDLENSNAADRIKKGDFIYFPGDSADKVYFIMHGRVKIGTYSDEGKEIIKAVLQPGELFGVLGIIGQEKRKDFAQAMEDDVRLCEKTNVDFRKLMIDNRDFTLHVTSMLGSKLIKTERRLESLIFKDARTRIVEFLRDIATDRGTRVGFETLVRDFLTHQEIANLTGTSRQTVTTVLNELRDENYIYFDRKRLLVRDLAKLSELIDAS